LALQAASIAAPQAVTSVTAAPAAMSGDASGVFAALLAKMNPAAAAKHASAAAPPRDQAQSETDGGASGVSAPSPALQAGALPGQTAVPLSLQQLRQQAMEDAQAQPGADADDASGESAPASKSSASLKSVDISRLRAAAQQVKSAQAASPGAPTLPVMPVPAPATDAQAQPASSAAATPAAAPAVTIVTANATAAPQPLQTLQQLRPLRNAGPNAAGLPADGEDQGDASPDTGAASPGQTDSKTAQLADPGKVAQLLLRPVTPAQTTEAHALPVTFDTHPDGQNANQNANHNSGQSSGQNAGQNAGQDTTNGAQRAQQDAPRDHAPTAVTNPPSPPAVNVHAQPVQQAGAKSADQPAAPSALAAAAPAQPAQAAQPLAASLHVAQAMPSAPQLDTPQLAVSIAAKAQGGEKLFDIRLDPAELGRIDVRLSVDSSGRAQAHLTADKPETLAMLQGDSATLSRSLRDSGLDLGNAGLSFSLRGEGNNSGGAPKSFARGRALSVTAVADAQPATALHNLASDRLDIRV